MNLTHMISIGSGSGSNDTLKVLTSTEVHVWCQRLFRHWLLGCMYSKKIIIPGGAKKRPELCVTIMASILYEDKFPFVHF